MQEVELLDGDGDSDGQGAGRTSEATGRRRVGRRRLIAGAAVVAVTLGVVQWVVTARESAALARLAQVPGVLSPVDATLDIVRRVPAADAAALFGTGGAGLERGKDGSQSLTWVDPAGGPGWTTELLGPNDTLAAVEHVFGGTSCQTDNEPGTDIGTSHRVVCLVTDGGMLLDGTGGNKDIPASTRQVVVLSTADGTVEARWPLERGQSLALLPDDVVVAGSATGDSVAVTAYDILTGTERWTHAEPLPTPAGDAQSATGMSLFRAGDLIAYSTPSGSLTLLSADGDVVRDHFSDLGDFTGGWMTDPTTSALIVQTQTADGRSRSTFIAADGDPAGDLTVDGQLVYASVDDGSAPGLMVTYDTSLHGWDARTGAARWSHDAYLTTSALILGGRIYAATSRGIIALDGRTGESLWSSEGRDILVTGALFTDGRHVLVLLETGGTAATPVLVAYDPVSGDEAFRAQYPQGISLVGEVDRRLVGYDAATDEYVLLG